MSEKRKKNFKSKNAASNKLSKSERRALQEQNRNDMYDDNRGISEEDSYLDSLNDSIPADYNPYENDVASYQKGMNYDLVDDDTYVNSLKQGWGRKRLKPQMYQQLDNMSGPAIEQNLYRYDHKTLDPQRIANFKAAAARFREQMRGKSKSERKAYSLQARARRAQVAKQYQARQVARIRKMSNPELRTWFLRKKAAQKLNNLKHKARLRYFLKNNPEAAKIYIQVMDVNKKTLRSLGLYDDLNKYTRSKIPSYSQAMKQLKYKYPKGTRAYRVGKGLYNVEKILDNNEIAFTQENYPPNPYAKPRKNRNTMSDSDF